MHFQPLCDAFSFLSPSRSIGFGSVGFIPLSEILVYHSIYNLGYSRADFVELIRLIDISYVSQLSKKPDGSRPHTRGSDRS